MKKEINRYALPPPPPNSTPADSNCKYADVIWQNRHQGHFKLLVHCYILFPYICVCVPSFSVAPIAAPQPCSLQHLQGILIHPLLNRRTNPANHPSQKPRPPVAAAAAAAQTLSTHRSCPPLPLFSPRNSAPRSLTTNPKPILG